MENSSVISGEIQPGIYPRQHTISKRLTFICRGPTEKASGLIDIYSDEWVALKIDINEGQNLNSIGINSSFYANLSSKSKDDVFTVSLEGAFISPGIYGVKQGEKLSDVILRAGGYKTNAYSYGGVLSRKSVAQKKLAFLRSADH